MRLWLLFLFYLVVKFMQCYNGKSCLSYNDRDILFGEGWVGFFNGSYMQMPCAEWSYYHLLGRKWIMPSPKFRVDLELGLSFDWALITVLELGLGKYILNNSFVNSKKHIPNTKIKYTLHDNQPLTDALLKGKWEIYYLVKNLLTFKQSIWK